MDESARPYTGPDDDTLAKASAPGMDPREIWPEFDQDYWDKRSHIHSGQLKSGPWLLEASRYADVNVDPRARHPGRGMPAQGYGIQQGPNPLQGTRGDWVDKDWRSASDGGAFNSSVRPPMSSDIPHPTKILDPNNKHQAQVLAHTQRSQDRERSLECAG